MPFFSIIMPTYNSEKLIEDTIHSLLSQSFKNYEVIVVDDGSTDGTLDKLQKYKDRIRIFSRSHDGQVTARNFGIKQAKGQYIVSFDHDDILYFDALTVYHKIINYFNHPTIIVAMMQYFKNINDIDFNSCDKERIQCTLFRCFLKKSSSRGLSNSALIIKKDRLIKVGGYLENSGAMDDNILLLRLGTEGPYIHIDNPITVGNRLHDHNFRKNLDYIFSGTIALIEAERNDIFPGGRRFKFDRCGSIGKNVISISKNYLGIHNFDKIFVLFIKARSMVLFGLIHKLFSRFYVSEKHIIS